MERCGKDTIFWLFCMGVPIFMAYNGGATAATVDNIQKVGNWSPTELGLLGAMDKIGITISAGVWGYVLQNVSSKTLLSVGLACNAVAVGIFAFSQNRYVMYFTKMVIGLTEGLQWVWMPLWVARWADEEKLPLWINLAGCVAPGVGNGLGMLFAGSSTANGLGYSTPFQVEAGVLAVLLVLMFMVPAEKMAITSCLKSAVKDDTVKNEIIDSDRKIRSFSEDQDLLNVEPLSRQTTEGQRPRVRSGSFLHPVLVVEDMSIRKQLEQLYHNPIYCRSAMAFASANYVNAGFAFIWIRLFIQLWTMGKQLSVVSYLVITGLGGFIGITISSNIEGGTEATTIPRFLRKAMVFSCAGAVMTVAGLLLQLRFGERFNLFLALTWGGIIVLCVGIASTTGLIQIVCNNSVEDEKLRSFGVGLAQGINNFFGQSVGPLLPQMVMDLLIYLFKLNEAQSLFAGAVSVCSVAFLVLGFVVTTLSAVERKERNQAANAGVNEKNEPSGPNGPKMQAVLEDPADEEPLLHTWCGNY